MPVMNPTSGVWPIACRATLFTLAVGVTLPCFGCTTSDDSGPGAAAQTTDAGHGTGSASGTFEGRAFEQVADSYWIGRPDDAAHTLVLYVFDRAVACAEIAEPGWDETVADQTQSIELKLIGTKPGGYPIPVNGRPATGEADVNYTLTSTRGTPSEVSASAGSVTLEDVAPEESADGRFDLTFAGGHLAGDFHAVYCAAGHEP